MENLHFAATEIKGGFWKYYSDLVKNSTVHAVFDRFKETGRFDALRCDWKEGEPNEPHVYWDSDVAKWMEGAAYLIEREPHPELEAIIDEYVGYIEKNQREDGYFNSHFLTVRPDEVFKHRHDHELYCTGHWIEAAIAYHKATGKDTLLNCMRKNIDCIWKAFVEEKTAAFTTPGHEEIELALLRLYRYTGDEMALKLARHFINVRGMGNPDDISERDLKYHQDNVPLREITEAVGHAVRANYLYTAMAMLAKEDGDDALLAACHRVFDNIINRRMSITGGVGASRHGEAYTFDYDLPNLTTYNETCAAIALAMFAGEMQNLEAKTVYGDIIEKVWYNGFIGGVSLSGDHFFYTVPMEIDLKKHAREGEWLPITERVKVFGCSCCPPNVVRMLGSIGRYMYSQDGDTVYCHQFAESETKLTVGGKDALLTVETEYPAKGTIRFRYHGEPVKLCVRIPGWCDEYEGETENGFAVFHLTDGGEAVVELPMNVHFMEANPAVADCAGRCAVTRGPLVYCMEGVDNGENLRDVTLLDNGNWTVSAEDWLPAPTITMDAERRTETTSLYRTRTASRVPVKAKLIPYLALANRGATDMIVWTMVK